MRQFQFLGTTDDHTTCDCCGKKDLKSTVAIRNLETGEDLFFGVTCAARALKLQVAEVRKGADAADRAEQERAEAARRAEAAAENARWIDFLMRATGGVRDWSGKPCTFLMIQALGGFAAARTRYADEKAALAA
ncbi:MAG: hypothetical protein FGM39_12075 [Phycisphaerales bacterium]|nr:hypothetical protein [Phycisphaerales bacterium]